MQQPIVQERPATLLDLTSEQRERLKGLVLNYFDPDKFRPSLGMRTSDTRFGEYSPRAVSEMLQSLSAVGLLDKQGVKSDAVYRVTAEGIAVKKARKAKKA